MDQIVNFLNDYIIYVTKYKDTALTGGGGHNVIFKRNFIIDRTFYTSTYSSYEYLFNDFIFTHFQLNLNHGLG